MIFRLLGVLILVGSGIGVAYRLNLRSSVALERAEAWLSFLRFVKLRVECFSLPAPTILKQCDDKLLRRCGYVSECVPEQFEELLAKCDGLDAETERILGGFSEDFGKGYWDEQLHSCEYYFSMLNEHKESLKKQVPIQRKLRSTLCISIVIAVIILFL